MVAAKAKAKPTAAPCPQCKEEIARPEENMVGHFVNWHVPAQDRSLVRSLIELSPERRARIIGYLPKE